jgi:hypothetical protein
MGFERDGREMLIVVVKATYTIPEPGQDAQLGGEQVPVVEADEFSGEPGMSAPRFETDFAHRKPDCDVLLVGSAYAPRAQPANRVQVALRVGRLSKQFCVVGQRAWYRGGRGISATSALPFTVMPISYDIAFGGTDRTQEAEGKIETFSANPVGKGYWRDHAQIDGQPLPNTEQVDRVIDDPGGQFAPCAFSPIGRSWTPRVSYAGTYDERWLENEAPFWPQDFDHRYFQAAPPDQIIPYPQGGEEVTLHNLTPDGFRGFRLPERRMPVSFIPHRGRDVTLTANIDTIVLEPDEERFTLTWRANLPLGKSIFDVKETVVGGVSRAWRRARAARGKRYYRNLAELVRDRAGRGNRK